MGYFFAASGGGGGYSAAVLADSPVAYYRLDETSGTAANDSAGGNNGTYIGSPTLNVAGLITGGNAAITCAAGPYVALGNPADLQIVGAITLECWYKPTNFPTSGNLHTLISKGFDGSSTSYELRIYNDSGTLKLQVGSFAGVTDYNTSWTITGWSAGTAKHIVAGYTGTAWEIFINGAQVSTTVQALGAIATATNAAIGAFINLSTPERKIDGTIDEVAIYDAWIGSTRIAAHAAAA